MSIRTRFSPSPTGIIHLGNSRTALFSALYAANKNGVFILRIEDTDAQRSEEQYVDILRADLQWLGINWQEGPGVDGEFGPYWQSQRLSIYAQYYTKLEEKKLIYPCFCTEDELLLSRKVQLSRGQAPRYAGTCKALTAETIAARMAEGEKPAWRFSVPKNTAVTFTDVVKGPQSFQSDDIGDFIIRRADGTSPFLFCNAIDDALMKVTHVLRGEDHLTNTPRQLMILNALEMHVPNYGHLSLIVGDDGAPLSKRHGSYSLNDLKDRGFLPQAIMNYLGRLGHVCDVPELMDFYQFAAHFQLDKLSRSPAHFDPVQLMYWQKHAVQALSTDAFWAWVGESAQQLVPKSMQDLFAQTIKMNVEYPSEAALWAEVMYADSATDEEADVILSETTPAFFSAAISAFNQHALDLPSVLADLKTATGSSGKKLFMPLRAALTGRLNGPELAPITVLLGKEKIVARLEQAKNRERGKQHAANI